MTEQSAATPPRPPAGWLVDPQQSGMLRYWDGTIWTEHRTPAPVMESPVVVSAAIPPESVWTRGWSNKVWSRVFVYGALAVALLLFLIVPAIKDDQKQHDEFCQQLAQDGLASSDC